MPRSARAWSHGTDEEPRAELVYGGPGAVLSQGMDYPFWSIGVPYSFLMAAIAVLHVFVSHFAIGGGLFLVVSEASARKAGDTDRLAFLQRLSRFFVLATLVFGALTGVGIWFVIGLLSPTATEALIHNFVWAWATEWAFFVIEILAALLYFYGWNRVSARTHLAYGWIYFVAAWLSLVVINGIVTFMLTPGRWLETGDFWDGFLNPGYASALVLRTGICILLAGCFALAVATRMRTEARPRLVRGAALWGIAGLVVATAGWAWYRVTIPDATLALLGERLSIPARALDLLLPFTAALGAGLALHAAVPRVGRLPGGVALLMLALGAFGSYEWFRESLRKPFVIQGYVYGNGIEVATAKSHSATGLLPAMAYRTSDPAVDLWRRSCASCHTLSGYNPVLPAYAGTDEAFVAASLRGLDTFRAPMPPFVGTDEERGILARWLWAQSDQRSLKQIHGAEGVALGERVYEARCARCHVVGGYKDKRDSLSGFTRQELAAFLLEPLADEMPVFSGSGEDKEALIEYLRTWTPAPRAPAGTPR